MKLMLKTLSFLLIILAEAKSEDIEIKLDSGALRLRSEPTSSSSECGRVESGTTFKALSLKNGWYKVQTNSSECPTAWVHSYFTTKYYQGPQNKNFLLSWNPSKERIKVNQGELVLRTRPGFNSNRCGKIDNGTEVERLLVHDGWYLVTTNNPNCPTAWIHSYYTEGNYQGPQTRSFLNSYTPTKEDEVVFSSEVAYTDLPIAPASVASPTESSKTTGADVSGGDTQSPVSSDDPTNDVVTMSTSGRTEVVELAEPQSEVGTDEATTSPQAGSDSELCTFYQRGSRNVDQTKTKNCLKLMEMAENGEISKEALEYSLKYLKANLGEFQDRSCADKTQRNVPQGIKNSCQFVVNDMNKRIRNFPHRSPSYFIDLCHGGEGSSNYGLINKNYVNRGTGSKDNKYTDKSGRRTTIVGPFVTGALSNFTPYRISRAYKNIGWERGCEKTITVNGKREIDASECAVLRLQVFGMTSSNNNTADKKPLHVSPYKSSWGCPSVGLANRWQLETLHENGPSLVMNYGPEQFHKESSINQCEND